MDSAADRTPSVDETDRRIIELVQSDGRASYQKISESVGLSRPSTRARLIRLLDERIIEVRGVVHPSAFGLHAYAHAVIAVEGAAGQIADHLALDDDIPFVSLTGGSHALVVELRCSDQRSLASALGRISALPNVSEVGTSVYCTIAKDAYWPPRPLSVAELDTTDRKLLELLQHDGRASFVDLSEHTNLSASAARARVSRLIDGGVIHIGARIRPDVRNTPHVLGFGLAVRGDTSAIIDELQKSDSIQYLASAIGRYDVIGTAIATSTAQMAVVLDSIRAERQVRKIETWTHLRFVKENYDRSPVHADESP